MAKRKHRRRRYVVDVPLQLTITVQLLAVLAGIGILYALGLFLLPGTDAINELSSREVRSFLTRANLIYFALAGAILGTVALVLTHRIAGPAFVIRRAIDAMRQGDYRPRLVLRRRDYMKPLAAAVLELREKLRQDEEQRRQMVADLVCEIEQGNLQGAKEICRRLRHASRPTSEADEATEPQPVAQRPRKVAVTESA